MRAPDFRSLHEALLAGGTAPSIAGRTVAELQDHYADLVDEAVAAGHAPAEAGTHALAALGDLDGLADAVNRRPELKSWAWRWPRVASVLYPAACVALLPAVPMLAGMRHASAVGRWTGGILLAALVTSTLFLVMQLTIRAG